MKKVNVEYVCDFCHETVGRQKIRHFKIPSTNKLDKKWEKLDVCDSCYLAFIQTRHEELAKKEEQGERWIISSTYRCYKNSLLEKYPFLDEFGIEEEYGVNRYGHPATKSYITVSSLEDLCAISKKADESNPVGFTGLLIDEIDGYMSVEIQEGE